MAGTRLRPRLRAGAGEPGRPGERRRRACRGSSAATTPAATARAAALLRHDQRPRRRALLARRGRAREAPRERLPQRQHRARQPARPAVRADGPRRLGGHRRRGDEAVRVHAVHARARASAATASRSTRTTSSWRAREFDFVDRFVELAGDINFAMPRHVVDLVAEALNDRGRALKGARVGVLGVAFKPNVRDARNSPAADVIAGLARARRRRRATTTRTSRRSATPTARVRRGAGARRRCSTARDVVVVVTAHRAIDWDASTRDADLVVDTVD